MKEKDTKTQSKGTKVLKTVLNTIINIMIVIVLIISLTIAVMSISSKANDGMSVIFGHTIENIQTDSMRGGSPDYEGGDFAAGDVIIGKFMDFLYTNEYKVGDIITYHDDLDGDDVLENVCHRIIEVHDDNGTLCYRTKGDANLEPDQEEGDYVSYIRAGDIGSVFYTADYQGKIIKGLGNVLTFLRSKFGFFICVLLPMIFFFLYELVRVVLNYSYYRKAKDEESQQKAVDEAVAEALANNGGDSSPAGMTAEEMEQFRQFQEFQKMQKAQHEAENKPEE